MNFENIYKVINILKIVKEKFSQCDNKNKTIKKGNSS